ncbi:MAG: hypothetical protein HY719_17345 [Planctomycetes bacterium]|nr:hypothetical protein [Planctomycetota bacterium]
MASSPHTYRVVPRFGLAEIEPPMIYNMHVRGAKSPKRNPYNTRYVADLIRKVDTGYRDEGEPLPLEIRAAPGRSEETLDGAAADADREWNGNGHGSGDRDGIGNGNGNGENHGGGHGNGRHSNGHGHNGRRCPGGHDGRAGARPGSTAVAGGRARDAKP